MLPCSALGQAHRCCKKIASSVQAGVEESVFEDEDLENAETTEVITEVIIVGTCISARVEDRSSFALVNLASPGKSVEHAEGRQSAGSVVSVVG